MPAKGRPRNPAIATAILDATRSLVVDVGYLQLSMEAVAARAGVSKPTLYLRYPSKAVLVFDAVFGKTKLRPIPDHGDIRAELNEAYSWAVEEMSAPEARAAIPGLMAEFAANPELAAFARAAVLDPEIARVRDCLTRAQRRGQVRANIDLDLVIDTFIGTAFTRVAILDRPVNQAFGRQMVDQLLDGIATD